MKRQYQPQHQRHTGRDLLLKTIRGSRLYGLEHEGSDYDYFEVYSGKGKMSQSIVGNQDVVRVSFDQFLNGVGLGFPEYLEAWWSPVKTVNELYFLSLRPGYADTVGRYIRTMKSFWSKDLKQRRHSARLYLNLDEYMTYGCFNPRLTDEQVDIVNWFAENSYYYPRL